MIRVMRFAEGWPLILSLGIVIASVPACAPVGGDSSVAGGAAPGPGLLGTEWRIESVDGFPVVDAYQTSMRFSADGRVSGSTGCNNFNGSATVGASALSFSPLATTRRACEGALSNQEHKLLDAMGAVRNYALDANGALTLLDGAGVTRMRLTRAL